jgi:hypothetical protein
MEIPLSHGALAAGPSPAASFFLLCRNDASDDAPALVPAAACPHSRSITNRNGRAAMSDDVSTENAEPEPRLIRDLGDWRFQRYLTMQLLPLFYLLLVFGALVVVAAIVGLCFWFSLTAGLIAAAIAPLALLIAVAVIRAALEYLVMAHRIMRNIERMDALPDQVSGLSERVDGITVHVDQLIRHVDDIHETLMHARPLLRSAAGTRRLLELVRIRRGRD